jgi:hypothetical protein
MENFTWGPNDAPFVAWRDPFVLFSGVVAAVGVVLWVVLVEGGGRVEYFRDHMTRKIC